MKQAWPLVTMRDVVIPVERVEDVDPTKEYRLLGIRLEGRGPFLREAVLGSQSAATKLYRVATGDLIYSRLFACRGAFGIIEPGLDGCHVSGEFPTFLPKPDTLDVRFTNYWFRLPSTLSRINQDCTGSTPLTRNRFKEQYFLALELPLPPLSEQRRIVARIEELAAKVEEARALRQQAAEEGSALDRALVDRVCNAETKERGGTALEAVCETITDGDHLTPSFSDDGVKFVFVGNVSSGHLHFNGCKHVTPEYFASLKEHRRPRRGDILYSAVGATLGVPAIVDSDESFCFQRHVAIIRPDRKVVESRFLWHVLRSNTVFRKAWASTTGSAQPTIPLRAIRELPIPRTPLSEQRRIVVYLDGLQAKVDALKKLQTDTAAELDAILPSILDKAFKGEL